MKAFSITLLKSTISALTMERQVEIHIVDTSTWRVREKTQGPIS
jgi:hypothetical protein